MSPSVLSSVLGSSNRADGLAQLLSLVKLMRDVNNGQTEQELL